MLGWINLSIESFIVDTFGADKWDQILKASGVHKNWVSSCPYSDKITYECVGVLVGVWWWRVSGVVLVCVAAAARVCKRRCARERVFFFARS